MTKEIGRTIGTFAKGDLPGRAIEIFPEIYVGFSKGDLPRTIGRFCQRRFAQDNYRTVAISAKGDLPYNYELLVTGDNSQREKSNRKIRLLSMITSHK